MTGAAYKIAHGPNLTADEVARLLALFKKANSEGLLSDGIFKAGGYKFLIYFQPRINGYEIEVRLEGSNDCLIYLKGAAVDQLWATLFPAPPKQKRAEPAEAIAAAEEALGIE